jgi:hypothetical protein
MKLTLRAPRCPQRARREVGLKSPFQRRADLVISEKYRASLHEHAAVRLAGEDVRPL